MKIFLVLLVIAILVALAFSGTMMSQVDEPKFKLVKKEGEIEIRQYPPLIVAEVTMAGPRKEAISQGFKLLADYIFGGNIPSSALDMEKGEQIAMTAPVTQQLKGDVWKVHFMMPDDYTMERLPKPNSDQVKLIPVPSKQFVVIRFSGLATEANIQKQLDKLKSYVSQNQLKVTGEPVFAFYNPPWTIPFLRRNEVMLELTK